MGKDIGKQIGKATAWSSVTEIMAKLISPIVNLVLARVLAPEAFGVVATITMVISFAELFTDAGFQKYIVQHEFEDEDALNRSTNVAFWTNLSFSALICLIIIFFKDPIASLVGSPGLGNSISIASVLIIVAAFSSIQMARYKRDFDFKTLFFVRIGTSFIPLVVTIPLALWLRNYWALLIGTFVSNLFNAVVLTARSKWKPKFYYSFSLLKEMFAFSAWTLLESIAIWLTSYIGIFIVGNVLNDYYLGIYKTAMATINAYMAIITSAITPVLFSALSRYQNDEKLFQDTYYRFQRLTAVFVLPMGVGIYLFSDLVTQILLGDQWMEASGFIGIWGLTSALMIVFSNFASEVYRSRGNPKLSLFAQVLHLAFVVPVLMICVNYSFETLYTARALVRLQGVLAALIIMQFVYRFSMIKVVRNVLPMAISAVLMGIAGYFLQMVSVGFGWQLLSILICVLVYFAILLAFFPRTRTELLGFVKPLFGKIKNKLYQK